MTNTINQTGLARTTDGELIMEPRVVYDSPLQEVGQGVYVVDEWDSDKYIMAKYIATTTNDFNQVELNEFLVFNAPQGVYLRFINTMNNITDDREISLFTAQVVRKIVQISFSGSGTKNRVRLARILYPK
jgi:hypothetical protein